ncbi:MAG TPA: glucose-1-phosphate thymidylyltransferase [Planctomycetaceae bacterium]|nr:glucose-1-phosphate thymidylyltransferase [Planctomycetaceae bacterium]
MHIILFEDGAVSRLFPTTIGRPAFALNVGTYRLIDLVSCLGGSIEIIIRPYLSAMVTTDFPDLWHSGQGERSNPILLLNARAVPDAALIRQLRQLIEQGRSGVARTNGRFDRDCIAAALFFRDNPFPGSFVGSSQLLGIVEDLNLPSLGISIPLLEYPHDLIRHQFLTMRENLAFRLQRGEYREADELGAGVYLANGCRPGSYCVFDASNGPIVIEKGANIGPYSYFKGPVYIGANAKIIEHSAIKGYVTLGAVTKVGGEVEGSIIESYTNKQHHGFLGHSYLGSWVNLGAGTCNSDLQSTYGEVVMEYGGQKVETGMQFVGCFIGDYAKTAINTSIFTGKTIGACSMSYGFVTTNVPSFVNYARSFGQVSEMTVDVMVQTQARMFARRSVVQRQCDIDLLREIYEMTKHERHLANEPLSL